MLSVQPFHNYPGLQQGVLTGAGVGSLEGIRPLYYLDDWLVLAVSTSPVEISQTPSSALSGTGGCHQVRAVFLNLFSSRDALVE